MAREIFSLKESEVARLYWKNILSGEITETSLPADFDRTKDYAAESCRISFPGSLSQRLLAFGSGHDLLLYVLLLAAFKTLIFKYTQKEDIMTAAPVYSTGSEPYEFNTFIVTRVALYSELTFEELLTKVKQAVIDGFKNQHFPIASVPGLDTVGLSFTRMMVLLENIHHKEPVSRIIHSTANDLTISFLRNTGGLEGVIEYNARLYKRSTVQDISEYYLRILDHISLQPGSQLKDIEIISEEERKKILVDFNATAVHIPEDKTLNGWFEDQVDMTPRNIAVSIPVESEDIDTDMNLEVAGHKKERPQGLVLYDSLSYRQLNDRANRLATALRKRGVRPNTIVAVMVERSIEMITSLFGILKAGGAYLPIDMETPVERIRYLLREAQIEILLTRRSQLPRLPAGTGTDSILCLEEVAGGSDSVSNANPGRLNCSPHLAYIIYTSGTTGQPKGVPVSHRGVVNYTLWRHQTCEYTGSDITLQPLTYSFDGFGSNLYSSLLSGGKLVCVPERRKYDFDYILKIIKDCRITNVSLVPVMYEALLDGACSRELDSLRFVVLAGEEAGAALVKKSVESHPHIKLINEYGPTEATVTAAARVGINDRNTMVVGKPIDNCHVFILDGSLKPVPIGVTGEICLAGVGLSWGYLNEPELTSEKFILSPLEENRQIYKTGDLGRWLSNGEVEILGRLDHQVKIRGNRVDLAEIERQMIKYDGVKEAVVIADAPLSGLNSGRSGAGDRHVILLYGYWVGDENIEADDYRDFLARYLPEYMIPAGFFHLETLPIGVNGKVNRKALPLPGTPLSRRYTAPADPVEETLAEIWAEILGVEKTNIGVDDNFFELGGHSLKGTVLIARIQQALSVKLSLGEIFEMPTIRELARHVDEREKDGFWAILPAPSRDYYVLSASQKRLFFHQQMMMEDTSYNLVSLVQLEGLLIREKLTAVFGDLIKRHEGLRTSFLIVNNEPVQKIHEEVEFKVDDYEADTGDSWQEAILKTFIRPFDLSRPPLLRTGLVRIGDENNILLVDIHHIIADGISMGILFREFMALYSGKGLPPVPLHYKDFAEWQDSGPVREEIREQEKYWLNRFEKGVPVLNIITDYERPNQQSYEGDCVHFELGEGDTAALREMAVAAEATLYILLLTVFNILLFKISGQEEIVVGTGTAGRRHADLHPIVGMFINMLVLQNSPASEKTVMDFLGEVRDRTLSDFENQEYPFDNLVEKLVKNRDFSRNPLFQVVFELQNIDVFSGRIPEVSVPGLKMFPLDYIRKISRFDICWLAALDNKRLVFTVQYCTRLFKKTTIERYVTYYREIVSAIRVNPHIKLHDISISSGYKSADLNMSADSFTDFGFSS